MKKSFGTAIAECPKCHTAIGDAHPYGWCIGCGEPLPADILARLPEVEASRQAQATAAVKIPQRAHAYSTPILTVVCIVWGVLTLIGTFIAAFSDLGRLIHPVVIVLVGVGSAVVYFGIAQVIDYLGRTAHATSRLCDILEKRPNI